MLRQIISSFFLFICNSFQLLLKSPRTYFKEHTKPNGKEARQLCLDLRKGSNQISLISHNIHEGRDIFYNYVLNPIINIYLKECPDIVCLQEIHDYEQYDYIKKALGFKYGYYADHKAIFTDYIIEESTVHYFKSMGIYRDTSFIMTKLSVGDKSIYIVNVTLTHDVTGFKQEHEINELNKYLDSQSIDYNLVITGHFNCLPNFSALTLMNMYTQVNPKKTYPSLYPLICFNRVFYTSHSISLKNNKLIQNHNQNIAHIPFSTDIFLSQNEI